MRLERLLSLPAIVVGGGLMYVGYFEIDIIYLFFYFFLGSIITVSGILLLMGRGIAPAPKKGVSEFKGEGTRGPEQPDVRAPEYCPTCGAPLTSAGKFCGSCGTP
ncbi:MAG: hypothetical protein ACE5G7_02915, partial [Candidatus Hydrothermarchaeaceae archaeon]